MKLCLGSSNQSTTGSALGPPGGTIWSTPSTTWNLQTQFLDLSLANLVYALYTLNVTVNFSSEPNWMHAYTTTRYLWQYCNMQTSVTHFNPFIFTRILTIIFKTQATRQISSFETQRLQSIPELRDNTITYDIGLRPTMHILTCAQELIGSHLRVKQNATKQTRSSAVAERPRDALCHWIFC